MPLSHIEHFLVASDDIDATRDWYARVLGMASVGDELVVVRSGKYRGRDVLAPKE